MMLTQVLAHPTWLHPPPTHRLGNALVESLDELIQSGHINPQLALRVLNQVSDSLAELVSV